MKNLPYLAWTSTLVLLALNLGLARADFETALLQKFQHQNQNAALQLKQDVEKSLAQAAALSPLEPEKALDLLRKCKDLLHDAGTLPRPDKDLLLRKLEESFQQAKDRLKSKEEAAKAIDPNPSSDLIPLKKLAVSQAFFTPNFTTVPSQSALQVTPRDFRSLDEISRILASISTCLGAVSVWRSRSRILSILS